jgi:hypothetical protein
MGKIGSGIRDKHPVSATLEQLSNSDSPLLWVQMKVRKNGFSKVLNFWCEVWNNHHNKKM